MKRIRRCECTECENLVWNDEWDAYICALEPNGITQYVGETKWQISDDKRIRICNKSTTHHLNPNGF